MNTKLLSGFPEHAKLSTLFRALTSKPVRTAVRLPKKAKRTVDAQVQKLVDYSFDKLTRP